MDTFHDVTDFDGDIGVNRGTALSILKRYLLAMFGQY
jgi:hypothetical protein